MEEVFRDERQQLAGVSFPEELTPFPQPTSAVGLFNPTPPLISPSGPQKLRPIRSTARNCSDSSNASHSSDLGFLPFHPHPHDLGFGPTIINNNNNLDSTQDLLNMKAQIDAHFISNFTSHLSHLHSSFSSSSDCSDDSEHKSEEEEQERSTSAKPRQKRRKKMESYLQDLLTQVISKQEQMHQQLMDVIESKERDRVLREEAWRQQEMERLHKEQQIRSQEAARSLALISFIQNALGVSEIQLPHVPVVLPSGLLDEDHGLHQSDPNNKRWPTSEVQALITLRAALDHKFYSLGSKMTTAWEEVSAGMAKMGYIRSSKKCKEKWENVNKYYRRATENGTKQSENAKSCPYFHELETLYKNRLITAKPNSPSNQHDQPSGNV